MANIKPTLKEPMSPQSEKFEKDFKKTMVNNNLNIHETQESLNEIDGMLTEVEQSLKKKIFSLAKMEALVFSDPKLSSVYDGMAENGEEKYGYHYNETIMNMIFNDYVLNSPQYLQKYKQAIPKEKKRRDKSGINQLKKQGEKKMTQSGLPKLEKTDVEESTSAGSAGGAAGYTGYAGPAAWSKKGDLLGNSETPEKIRKPIANITTISESNYLTDTSGFEKYINALNEESDADFISRNGSNTYGSVDNMTPENQKIIKSDIQNRKFNNNNNIKDGIALKEEPVDEKAKSKAQQRFMGMVHAVQKGELSPDEVGGSVEKAAETMTDKDAEDFASTKHKGLPEKIKEDTQTMIQNNGTSMSNKAQPTGDQSSGVPVGMQATGGLQESENLLEEINKELEAFSIHHNKLKLMSEERKTNSQILNQRVGDENKKNFKKDFQDSDTKDIIDVEKELQYKDQQTDVPKDPQKLGQDIEKTEIKTADMKGDEALKNVGNSTNNDGDEIPKRNLTTDEQEEVNLYRNGLHSPIFDNEPSERYKERMKADMGDEIYDQREKQIAFKGKAPMYNKDPQPIEDTTADKVQFDKEQTGWNERMGIGNEKSLKESMITGRYIDALGKRRLIEFRLNEAVLNESAEDLFILDFTGLGNTYNNKTVDKQVTVNETVVKAIDSHKFYTDGKSIVAVKNPVQNINENEHKDEKPVINEQMEKMKHLLGYKPDSFTNTSNVKKNRGF